MKKEFMCGGCGYEAKKLAEMNSCPLCIPCSGCEETIKLCSCIEGE